MTSHLVLGILWSIEPGHYSYDKPSSPPKGLDSPKSHVKCCSAQQ